MDGFVKKQNVTSDQLTETITAIKLQMQDVADQCDNLKDISDTNFDFYQITGQEAKNDYDYYNNQSDDENPKFKTYLEMMKYIYKTPFKKIDSLAFKSN